MSKDIRGLLEAFKGFPEAAQRRLLAAMDRMNRADWTAELVRRGERPADLADLPTAELARRVASLA